MPQSYDARYYAVPDAQRKQMGEGDYAAGLEPATWYPEGRNEARKKEELAYIEQGGVQRYEIAVGIS